MRVWVEGECVTCYGMGMVQPALRPVSEDAELELCPKCHGYGRVPELLPSRGFIDAIVASAAVSEGWGYRSRIACAQFIEATY